MAGRTGWPVVFGCTTSESGEIFRQDADGLMGLGRDRVSVQAQLAKTHAIDNGFALCFGRCVVWEYRRRWGRQLCG